MSHTVQTTHASGTFDAPLVSRRPTEKDKILHCMEIAGGYMCQLEKVTAERDALLAAQMTEEKAREVLGGEINADGELNGWTMSISGGEAFLSETAGFTELQLKAIAWWMENKGEGR